MEERKFIKIKNETREMNCSEVYEQFKKFIYKTALSFNNSSESLEDLVQIGSLGLMKAFNSYKIESGYAFSTLLGRILINEFLMQIRKEKNRKTGTYETSFDDYLYVNENGNYLTLLDLVKEPTDCEEIVMENLNNIELINYISELEPRNGNIIKSFYFDNISQVQIGRKFNISQSYVARLIEKSLKILKSKYEKGEIEMITKREACYEIFNNNQGATRERVISLVIEKVGVTKTTAQTYYPLWRKEFIDKTIFPNSEKTKKQEKSKIITKSTDIITETANKITEVADKSPIKQVIVNKNITPGWGKINEEFEEEVKDMDAKNKERKEIVSNEDDDIFEVTKLVPVVMKGKHGTYNFDKSGVKSTPTENFISKDKMDEALEALAIWERCYGKEGVQAC
ncbi:MULTISPECIES: sigma-70 family RNA polymerase sigma factor [Clostridium]|uniref:Sigma-70 family RNA polymerase sigma factor n=1 Tax=Clostridium frigoriphilum TaxID=443253 RepID=A0ABU7UHJ8_9CLOT|nr:sigma-70 family RNA polymerase sigma factor [Clostridium sp. DSM 17811]MBU3098357.1 sigma-70 family RNA polymerase sigma factor [Clostridium sp. DSM 17811]